MDNLKVIKRTNCLSEHFIVTDLDVWIIRPVPLMKQKFSYSITFGSLKHKRHDC